jgi:GT2 family glycosyltransferase
LAESMNHFPIRVFAVIVLYKMAPQDSISFQTLNAAMKYTPPGKLFLKTFFYDNTPGGQAFGSYPEGSSYEAPGENRGIADAYNRAIEIAHQEGFDWLLTLDQDTQLPIDFLEKLADTAAFVTPLKQVAAIVPLIYDKATLISPNAGSYTFSPKKFPEEFIGISLENLTSALNSASMVRVRSLRSVGGYDSRFWLDYSDAVMYHRLQFNGMRVFVSGNIRVEHELSVMDMKHRVSIERYEGILSAESAYCDAYMGRAADLQLIMKLAYRSFYKFWGWRDGLSYSRIAFRFLCRRLFYTRKHRMEIWEHSVRSRLANSSA